MNKRKDAKDVIYARIKKQKMSEKREQSTCMYYVHDEVEKPRATHNQS